MSRVSRSGSIKENKSVIKKFECICNYRTNYYRDFVKHMHRRHPEEMGPIDGSQEECPGCKSIFKDLSKHLLCKGKI